MKTYTSHALYLNSKAPIPREEFRQELDRLLPPLLETLSKRLGTPVTAQKASS